ncbi:MAG: pilus assembly protein [Acidimicrobiia bacterium]|nr:pilus assembly protein [Acidimicrobiia bacterium]MDH3469837.1 pilus assembly protein [Acidimicrobiia bacterium]
MRERGSAVVEFAIVLPLVLAVLAAGVEVVVLARTQLELVNAAREGARQAATSPDPARAVAAAQEALGPELGGRLRVTVERPAVVGQSATVHLRLQHRVAAPLLGGFTVELRSRAVMRVER